MTAIAGRKPRLLVLNQYYSPGVEATAHLLTELCESLADEFDITVVTGTLHSPPAGPGRFVRNGVEVIRVRSTSFERRRLWLRGINYTTFFVQSLLTGMRVDRPDAVLCMTDPPFIGDVALAIARRFRVPFAVITQDVFPEIAVELKRLESRALVGLLRVLVAFYLRRADCVVAIGETMRRRLEHKGASQGRVEVIPNWVSAAALQPQPKDNGWALEHGLADRFVVMHSGNIGHAQNLDALVRGATFLRDLDRLVIAIIGAGARLGELIELADRLEADNVRFLPYQPRERLSESLSAADIHVVGLAKGLSGYVVPSRLYGILSVGRPVIVAADSESETAQVVERMGCGVVLPPGRPELLGQAIRTAYEGGYPLEEMGRRGRRYVAAEADRAVAVARYRRVLRSLTATA